MARIGASRQITVGPRFLHAVSDPAGNSAKARLYLFLEYRAYARALLAESPEHASEIAILAVFVA